MGAHIYYERHLPDYGSPEDMDGKWPGYDFTVGERDGGVFITISPRTKTDKGSSHYSVFLNVKEAKELLDGIQDSINQAEPKNVPHPDMARDTQ